MPSRGFKHRFVNAALGLYAAGYALAWIAFQVRMFRAEGRFGWALFGWVVPFFEALLWPVFLAGWLTRG